MCQSDSSLEVYAQVHVQPRGLPRAETSSQQSADTPLHACRLVRQTGGHYAVYIHSFEAYQGHDQQVSVRVELHPGLWYSISFRVLDGHGNIAHSKNSTFLVRHGSSHAAAAAEAGLIEREYAWEQRQDQCGSEWETVHEDEVCAQRFV